MSLACPHRIRLRAHVSLVNFDILFSQSEIQQSCHDYVFFQSLIKLCPQPIVLTVTPRSGVGLDRPHQFNIRLS